MLLCQANKEGRSNRQPTWQKGWGSYTATGASCDPTTVPPCLQILTRQCRMTGFNRNRKVYNTRCHSSSLCAQKQPAVLYLVPATFLGSKAVERRARLAGVRSRIHMPAIRYSMVSSCPVRPITSASIAKQALSKACACTTTASVCDSLIMLDGITF